MKSKYLAIFILIVLFVLYFKYRLPNYNIRTGIGRITGKIVSDPLPNTKAIILKSDVCKYKLFVFFKHSLGYGDKIRVWGLIFKPHDFKNPGGYPLSLEMKRKGICAYVKVKNYEILKRSDSIWSRVHSLRISLVKRFIDVSEPFRTFVLGLILGAKEAIDKDKREVFYKTGLGHLLAVSGFHFGIILGFTFFIFLLVLKILNIVVYLPFEFLPSRLAHIMNISIVPFILTLTGFHISAVRASIMYVVYVILCIFERDISLFRIATVALFIMLLINPLDIVSAGFQYTFVAIFSIAFLLERLENTARFKKFVLISVCLSFVLAPITAFHFHRIYPWGLISNTVFLPVFSFIIPILIAVLFLSLSGVNLIPVCNFAVKLIFNLIKSISKFPLSEIFITKNQTIIILVLSVALLYLISKRRFFVLLGVVSLLLLVVSYFKTKEPRAIFFDMGRRGCATLIVGKKSNLLVDAGSYNRLGCHELIYSLLWQDIKHLDRLIITSKSKGHTLCVKYLQGIIHVGKILDYSLRKQLVIKGVCFVKRRKDCFCKICRLKDGSVIIDNKNFYPWKEGALKVSLED